MLAGFATYSCSKESTMDKLHKTNVGGGLDWARRATNLNFNSNNSAVVEHVLDIPPVSEAGAEAASFLTVLPNTLGGIIITMRGVAALNDVIAKQRALGGSPAVVVQLTGAVTDAFNSVAGKCELLRDGTAPFVSFQADGGMAAVIRATRTSFAREACRAHFKNPTMGLMTVRLQEHVLQAVNAVVDEGKTTTILAMEMPALG